MVQTIVLLTQILITLTTLTRIHVDSLEYKNRLELSGATRETPEGRILLAHYVAKSVDAMHTVLGGPMVHADIQSQQFLLGTITAIFTYY
jgi:hypothetical protein